MWAAYVGPEWAQHGSHLVVFVMGSKWAPIIGPMWAEHVGPTSFWPLGPSGPIWANLDGAMVGPHLAQYWFYMGFIVGFCRGPTRQPNGLNAGCIMGPTSVLPLGPKWAHMGSSLGGAKMGPRWHPHRTARGLLLGPRWATIMGSRWAPIIGPMLALHLGPMYIMDPPTSAWPHHRTGS